MTPLLTLLFSLLFSSTGQTQTPLDGDFTVCSNQSKLSYKVVHKFHEVKGVTQEMEGRAVLKGDQGEVMIRVPVTSFDSGNANRDAHMKEVIGAHRFPYVVFKGKLKKKNEPNRFTANGSLEFHGIENSLETEVSANDEGNQVRVTLSFLISLEKYKVERPSLLFVKVDDAVTLEGNLIFVSSSNKASCNENKALKLL